MKYYQLAVLLASAALLSAQETPRQSQGSTVEFDGQGNPLISSHFSEIQTADGLRSTVTQQSINGRMVPLEGIEEHVVRSEGGVRVVERLVKHYGPNGNVESTDKIQIEESKNSDGSATTKTAVYRSDLNGGFQLAERSTRESKKSGSDTAEELVIERPSINGSFQMAEKSSVSSRHTGEGKLERAQTIYRIDQTGRQYEALRRVTETVSTGKQITENTAQYEPNEQGTLQLSSQTVSKTSKNPDGSEVSQVDVYSKQRLGGAMESSGQPNQLSEELVIERKLGPNGTVIESTSVRRPTLADPGRLGALQKVSERVCTGACK